MVFLLRTNMLKFYLHTPHLRGWDMVFGEMLEKMAVSGLVDALDELNICVNGVLDGMSYILDPLKEISPKIRIRHVAHNASRWEWPTINTIHRDCMIDDGEVHYIGYAHLKGLSRSNLHDARARDWRHYLSYWTIERWEDNIKILNQGYDSAGVNWMTEPWPHYSGNFWWARSTHIKTLPVLEDPVILKEMYGDRYQSKICYSRPFLAPEEYRLECEGWIGANPAQTYQLHQSPGNPNFMFHYQNTYPARLYREDQ